MLEGFLSFLFEFLGELFLSFFLDGKEPSKKRIRENIEELKQESWFKTLYEEPQYKRLIDGHESVRFFIGEKGAKKIKKNEEYQQKLKDLLHEAHLFEPSYIEKKSYKGKFTK